MFAALTVVTCVLALALIATGAAKLAGHTATVESLTTVGFPVKFAPALASAELAGAVGLLVGLHWRPIGAGRRSRPVLPRRCRSSRARPTGKSGACSRPLRIGLERLGVTAHHSLNPSLPNSILACTPASVRLL